jgi:hypothetical protein
MHAQYSRLWTLGFAVVVTIGCLGIILPGPASADIPRMINYQGLVVDKETGEPLPGEHRLVFRICDSPSGGSILWSEEQSVTADTTGVVSVLVGSDEKIDVSFDTDCWLEVEVDGEVLNPRRELVSVPYAFKALNSDSLGGVGAGGYAAAAHNHDDRYYTETELNSAGTINNGGNPVDWTKLKNAPAGLADGTDNVGPGDGYSLDASDGSPVDAVYVDQDGEVGIGTTTPAAEIHIRSTTPTILVEAMSGDSEVSLKSSGDASAEVWTIYKDSGTDDLRFYQNGDKVTIDNSTGNVGIGTTAPTAAKLQVENSSGDAIYAKSTSGTGIFAVHGSAVGGEGDAAVVATSATTTAIRAYSTSGAGVYGTSAGASIPAIHGYHSGDGPGIYGSGGGVYPAIEAMRDDAGTAVGGYANTGIGVLGYASSTSGFPVAGIQTGYLTTDIGGYWRPGGFFAGRNGVVGYSETSGGYGVLGLTDHLAGWAGVFYSGVGNGVAITAPSGKTGLIVYGGSKSAAVTTSDGDRMLYCEEASEVWFSDYGFGKLNGGVAQVPMDPVFAQTVNLSEPYHVFLQAYGAAELYVSSRSADGFEVRLGDGDPSVEFSYRIVAKRIGFEKDRLARAPWMEEASGLRPGTAQAQQGED